MLHIGNNLAPENPELFKEKKGFTMKFIWIILMCLSTLMNIGLGDCFSQRDTVNSGGDIRNIFDYQLEYSKSGRLGLFTYKVYNKENYDDYEELFPTAFDFYEFETVKTSETGNDYNKFQLHRIHRCSEYFNHIVSSKGLSFHYLDNNDCFLFWVETDTLGGKKPYYVKMQKKIAGKWNQAREFIRDSIEIIGIHSLYDSIKNESIFYHHLRSLILEKRNSPYYYTCPKEGDWSEQKSFLPYCRGTWTLQNANYLHLRKDGTKEFFIQLNPGLLDSTLGETKYDPAIYVTELKPGDSEWSYPRMIYSDKDTAYQKIFYFVDSQNVHYIVGNQKKYILNNNNNNLPLDIFYMVSLDGINWTHPEIIYSHKKEVIGEFCFIQDMQAVMDRNGIIHIVWHYVSLLHLQEGLPAFTISGNYFNGWSKPDSLKTDYSDVHIPPRVINDPIGDSHLFYIFTENKENLKFYSSLIHANLSREYSVTGLSEHKENHIEKEPIHCRNYPSPFSDKTDFQIISKIPLRMELKIYNIIGQEVWNRKTEEYAQVKKELKWNGKDRNGRSLPSGVYIYVVEGIDRNGERYISKGKTLKLK